MTNVTHIIPCRGAESDHYYASNASLEDKYSRSMPSLDADPETDPTLYVVQFLARIDYVESYFPVIGQISYRAVDELIRDLGIPSDTIVSSSHGMCKEHILKSKKKILAMNASKYDLTIPSNF